MKGHEQLYHPSEASGRDFLCHTEDWGCKLLFSVGAGVIWFIAAVPVTAQTVTNIQGPFISARVTPLVMTNDLRSLPKVRPWRPGDPVKLIEDLEEDIEPPGAPQPQGNERRRSRSPLHIAGGAAALLPAPGSGLTANFEGNVAGGLLPPDTVGEAGPNHYIQVVNTQFSIYDKAGNLLAGPSPINSLWMNFGGPCETENNGDPIVQYDHLADRWVISQFALPGGAAGFHQCFAVSRTPDPVTGGWNLYDFTMPAFPDYPKITVWPDGYYMGTQRSFPSGGLDVFAFDRTNMLAGTPANFVQFFVSGNSLFLMPSDLDGAAPPAGTPNFFLRQVDGDVWGGVDRLELFTFTVNWATPAASAFTALTILPTAPFDSVLCGGGLIGACVPQPGTSQTLETLTVWPMWRLQYRNFGTHETMVINHTVDADVDHAGIRWYELRRPPSGAWAIFQQATFSPDEGTPGFADDVHRWMGSVAMDGAGNIALGYSVSSDTVYPSIRYTGRQAQDPPGTMTWGEVTVVSGAGAQTHGSGRWGNYSAMTVDPVDECTFWYTTEYYASTTEAGWQTRIASFTLDNQPPVINCPSGIIQSTDPGQCAAVVNYSVTATDLCGAATIVCTPPSGSVFLKGSTTVACTATDRAGHSSACSFTVTVKDDELPQISCPANIVRPTDPGECSASVTYVVTATDNCPGVTVTCVPPSGTEFAKGITTVTCKAMDSGSNSSTCRFTVLIEDQERPRVACMEGTNPSGKKVPTAGRNPKSGQNPDGCYKLLAEDNCDSNPKIFIHDSASSFVAGPFASGDQVKITQAPGVQPKWRPGPGAIAAHIHLRGDALLVAADASGNTSTPVSCLVPPRPK